MQSGRFVPASDFIPLAERSGCIIAITWLVFERIADCVKEWTALPKPFAIAVNVSPQVLSDQDFVPRLKKLKSALDELGFGLTIEITEDCLVQGDDSSLASLERVRKLGVDLSIDDFGKGYSSLSYLKQIPATEIKIDRRFIGTIAIDGKDKQIAKTVVELAHAFDMRVVAEGVDNAEALFVLRGLGCEMAQGFYIGRPMRGDLVQEWHDHYVASATTPAGSVPQLRLARAKA
jgi:EAL domain-containing protein (putative c-di-GMP-specific phosphodiesterase class I)